jgi:hypothetical protein
MFVKLFKRIFCKHDFKLTRKVFLGAFYNCTKCGKEAYLSEYEYDLQQETLREQASRDFN